MELLWFLLVTIGLFGWFVYFVVKGLGEFILTLFGRKKQYWNGTTKFLFFLKGELRWLRKKNVTWGSGKPYQLYF